MVVEILASHAHSRLVPLLERLLSDGRVMRGANREGFPMRYAAAWGLVDPLLKNPGQNLGINPDVVAAAAQHHDSRLAGPSLITLGLLAPHSDAFLPAVLDAALIPGDAALVVMISCRIGRPDNAVSEDIRHRVGDHPALKLLDLYGREEILTEEAWSKWLAENPEVNGWLAGIQSPDGLNRALRFALHFLLEAKVEHLLACADARQDALAWIPMQKKKPNNSREFLRYFRYNPPLAVLFLIYLFTNFHGVRCRI